MLSKVNRLKGKANFDLVFKKGEKQYSPYFVVYRYLPDSGAKQEANVLQRLPSKFGIVTSKKVGGAVSRNRARRIIGEAIRAHLEKFTYGATYVFIALKTSAEAKLEQVQECVDKLN